MPRKTNANPKIAVADIVQGVPDRDYQTFQTTTDIAAFIVQYGGVNPGLEARVAGATKVKFDVNGSNVITTLIVSKA